MGWRDEDGRMNLYDQNDNLVLEVKDDGSLVKGSTGATADPFGGSLPVIPEKYGALGDGVTDDSAALLTWIASGLPLALTQGKTYMHRKMLSFSATGQTLSGNGGTLKRIAQASGTTATSIASGVTNQIVLTGGSNPFQVNDQIVVSQGGASGTMDLPHYISAINGQTITIAGTFAVTLSGTTNVYLGGHQLYVPAAYDNCRITDVTLDGNKANWTLTNWVVGVGVYVDANHNTLVAHCRFNNQIGDAMETNDSYQAVFFSCDVENCAGRGMSYGGTGNDYGNKVIACRFYNCETDPNAHLGPGAGSDDGHGAINFSLGGNDALIHGNQLDTGITGIGGGNSATQSGVTISDNVIRNMSSTSIEGINAASPAIRYTITGNRIYSSGTMNLNQSSGFSGATEWTVHNNLFVESVLNISNYQQISVLGNRFYSAGTALTFITLNNSGGAVGVQQGIINGNRFAGGARHIVGAAGDTGLIITDNYLYNAAGTDFINLSTASGDIQIANNVILAAAATTTSTNGITINGQVEVRNNIIDLTVALGNAAIVLGASGVKARIMGNTIICRTAVNGIVITAGAADTELRDNTLNTTYSDAGTRTVKMGNRIAWTAAVNGRAVLVAGTVTVSTGEVRTADNILLTCVLVGGTQGILSVSTIVDKTSFVINSSNGADTSTVYWEIRH